MFKFAIFLCILSLSSFRRKVKNRLEKNLQSKINVIDITNMFLSITYSVQIKYEVTRLGIIELYSSTKMFEFHTGQKVRIAYGLKNR